MRNIEILKYQGKKYAQFDDVVISESRFDLYVNGKKFFSFICIDKQLKEMTYGYLFSAGLIRKVEDVSSFVIKDSDIIVDLNCVDENVNFRKTLSCSSDQVYNLYSNFITSSQLHQKTGAVHSMAIADVNVIIQIDDLSRHTALDKLVGYCVLNDIDMSNKVLLLTCRITESIARKVVATSIPVILSKAAVTEQAIEICNEQGVLLVGFMRSDSFNVYNFPERIH